MLLRRNAIGGIRTSAASSVAAALLAAKEVEDAATCRAFSWEAKSAVECELLENQIPAPAATVLPMRTSTEHA